MTNFAKLTGDIAVLSLADIRVLALTYSLEVEQNGTRRLREAPGKPSLEEREREAKRKERLESAAESNPISETQGSLARLDLNAEYHTQPSPQTVENEVWCPCFDNEKVGEHKQIEELEAPSEQQIDYEKEEPTAVLGERTEHTTSSAQSRCGLPTMDPEQRTFQQSGDDSDSEGGEWITSSNVALHKSRDLGLFPTLPAQAHDVLASTVKRKTPKKTAVLKVACLTGDFAMQNIALQMGLNVFGVGGKKVTEVRTWVLRCHACFK